MGRRFQRVVVVVVVVVVRKAAAPRSLGEHKATTAVRQNERQQRRLILFYGLRDVAVFDIITRSPGQSRHMPRRRVLTPRVTSPWRPVPRVEVEKRCDWWKCFPPGCSPAENDGNTFVIGGGCLINAPARIPFGNLYWSVFLMTSGYSGEFCFNCGSID